MACFGLCPECLHFGEGERWCCYPHAFVIMSHRKIKPGLSLEQGTGREAELIAKCTGEIGQVGEPDPKGNL